MNPRKTIAIRETPADKDFPWISRNNREIFLSPKPGLETISFKNQKGLIDYVYHCTSRGYLVG